VSLANKKDKYISSNLSIPSVDDQIQSITIVYCSLMPVIHIEDWDKHNLVKFAYTWLNLPMARRHGFKLKPIFINAPAVSKKDAHFKSDQKTKK